MLGHNLERAAKLVEQEPILKPEPVNKCTLMIKKIVREPAQTQKAANKLIAQVFFHSYEMYTYMV